MPENYDTLLDLVGAVLRCDSIDMATRCWAKDLKRRIYRRIYGSDMLADLFAGD